MARVRIELWGGERDGESFEVDELFQYFTFAGLEPPDGGHYPPNPVAPVVYEYTPATTASGAIRYQVSQRKPSEPDPESP